MHSIRSLRLVRTLDFSRCFSRNLSTPPTTPAVQYAGTDVEEAYFRKVAEEDEKLRVAYDRMPASYPAHSQAPDSVLSNQDAFRKRLLYRSRQRGWLEVDLLMGTWASKHLSELNDQELLLYEKLLNKETVDVYNILLGKEPVTSDIDNHITHKLIKFVSNSPLGRADPRNYEQIKKSMSN